MAPSRPEAIISPAHPASAKTQPLFPGPLSRHYNHFFLRKKRSMTIAMLPNTMRPQGSPWRLQLRIYLKFMRNTDDKGEAHKDGRMTVSTFITAFVR